MKTHILSVVCALVVLFTLGLRGQGVATVVRLGEYKEINAGEVLDRLVIENGGVVVMNGGAVGTNLPIPAVSIDIRPGGRFVMNGGTYGDFSNYGVAELYGGRKTNSRSCENHGNLQLAGGDLGFQLVQFEGSIDVYYSYTNPPNWEIDAGGSSYAEPPIIRIFGTKNALPSGTYTVSQLLAQGGTVPYPGYVLFEDLVKQWMPWGSGSRSIGLLLDDDWSGRVVIVSYVEPTSPSSGIQSAIEYSWQGTTGRTYQVQISTNLVSQKWLNLGLPMTGVTGKNSIFDTADPPHKFYRVKLVH